jgi:hypothetical protein
MSAEPWWPPVWVEDGVGEKVRYMEVSGHPRIYAIVPSEPGDEEQLMWVHFFGGPSVLMDYQGELGVRCLLIDMAISAPSPSPGSSAGPGP